MSDHDRVEAEQLEFDSKLQAIGEAIRRLAVSQKGDNLALLSLLRALEALHQEIRDTLFQDSLPDSRQALYSLLKDIEASGGWPYIHRMKLRSLLAGFQNLSDGDVVTLFTGPDSAADAETID
jgi:hypothetical protein